jgi:hypothetical protein
MTHQPPLVPGGGGTKYWDPDEQRWKNKPPPRKIPPALSGVPQGKKQLDGRESTKRRDAAIRRAGSNADKEWIREARRALLHVADTQELLTTDDIWAVLNTRNIRAPHEPRAMGAVIKWAEGQKHIIGTPNYQATKRVTGHSGPVRVWRSLRLTG